ncbi:MAG: ATPase [Candidatus Amulumruptor caecigallinarius]|nr:ATPase [Candidatus Amulumruptor caecigallinarius]
MKYNIIADAGSTKIEWVVTDAEWNETQRLTTSGLNALLAGEEEISGLLSELKSALPEDAEYGEVHYYGAGCATPAICVKAENAIRASLGGGEVHAYTDLLGAARSLHGTQRGIACILGTGSNSCLYNGRSIEQNVPSLGFILGDEGSGAALGKRLVSDAFKGHLPPVIREKFLATYELSLAEILEKVYRQPSPNRYLASLVPFIKEHLWNPYIYSLVRKEFESFLNRNVQFYEGARTLPIAFTGSIASNFSDILKTAAANLGYKTGKITAHPINGLVEYHRNRARI